MKDTLKKVLEVNVAPEAAFNKFVNSLSEWWPAEYTWAQSGLQTIAIEPKEGGKCYEVGPRGFRCDWGVVMVYEPSRRIVFSWQISPARVPEPDPEKVSEIEVIFTEKGEEMTQVILEHRCFSRHGEQGDEYRKAMDSPQGWDYMLGRYEQYLVHDF